MTTTRTATAHDDAFEPASGVFCTVPPRAAVTSADIAEYMDLVHQVVARILRRVPRNVLRDDLVAAGTYGLMDALRKTQGTRDGRFEAYARIRIRGAVIDELRNEDWLARSARADANEQAKATEGAAPGTLVGLDDLAPGQLPVARPSTSPLDSAVRTSEQAALARAVADLPEREARILDLHYFQGMQLKDIAALLHVSEARVSQLHSRAVSMLRTALGERAEDFAA
ncbi:MAG TPA: sigma-70 family RNA polymerase sigma factor [Polyangiaceae bacterium]|jgi:RNA polymerase sigma factor for flagellar operon FliA